MHTHMWVPRTETLVSLSFKDMLRRLGEEKRLSLLAVGTMTAVALLRWGFPVLTLVCSQMKHIASAGEPHRVLCAVVAAHRVVRTVPWSQLGPRLSTELPKAEICARLVAARTMCSADGDCHQGQCPFVQWCGPWRPPGLTHPQPIHRSVFKPTFCVNCVCRPRTCFAPRSTGPT